MSRRRPTQIIPPRPDAAGASRVTAAGQAGRLPPDFPALSATWVREICPTDADHRAEARKRWRVATGQDSGNPEQTAGRSKVQRIQPDAHSPAQWHKAYQHGFGVYESHELLVLVQLWSAPAHNQRSPRDYHAQAVLLGQDDGAAQAGPKEPSRLQRLVTKDAGPNLLSWEYFAPLTQVGPQQLAWPLFAHPLYLAAMTHRLLLAVEVLFEHKVVHLDLKPENVGLALPDGLRVDPATGQAYGSLRLKALPLKLLDFEFSVHHALSYPGLPPSNDYTSPFARQRLTLAAAHATQSNAWAQAVDWGADLYALGCMLDDWADWACDFVSAYRQKLRNEVGPQHYQDSGLQVQCDTWAEDLAWLARFAQTLKAQDRSADEALARQFDLPARPSTPLAGLRLQLAQRFPALRDGGRELELRFSFALPQGPALAYAANHAKIPSAEGPRVSALARLFASGDIILKRAVGWVAQSIRDQRRTWAIGGVALSLSASAWVWRTELVDFGYYVQRSVVNHTTLWAYAAVVDDLDAEGRTWRLKPTLWLADTLSPGQAVRAVLRGVDYLAVIREDGFMSDTSKNRAIARNARVRYLRAAEQLASLPDRELGLADVSHAVERVLLGVYHYGSWLESIQDDAPLNHPVGPLLSALDKLTQHQGWPLAALLGLHFVGCYEPQAVDSVLQARWLAQLRQLPPETPSREKYLSFAHGVERRLATGQNTCLLIRT